MTDGYDRHSPMIEINSAITTPVIKKQIDPYKGGVCWKVNSTSSTGGSVVSSVRPSFIGLPILRNASGYDGKCQISVTSLIKFS